MQIADARNRIYCQYRNMFFKKYTSLKREMTINRSEITRPFMLVFSFNILFEENLSKEDMKIFHRK